MLTDREVRAAKPRDRAYKLVDGGGLHLYVTPAGGRLWRYRYAWQRREKLLSLGRYPAMSLLEARAARDAARAELAAGRDPSMTKRIQRAAGVVASHSFEAVAREWHARQAPGWTSRHAADVLDSLVRDVFPTIGALPIADIPVPTVLDVLRRIEARAAIETAHRVRQRISAVFVHAIGTGRTAADPAAIIKPLLGKVRRGRQPALVDIDELRAMLRTAEQEVAHPVTKLALRLLALTAVRPGEVRGAGWGEFEQLAGAAPLWRLSAARTKMSREHLVPLARQSVEVIEAVRTLTGRGPLLFPSIRRAHQPMSENALGYLLHRAGYHGRHVPHGFRAAFSTIMNERHRADRGVIDLMLAHVAGDKIEAAYNRSRHLGRQRELAQEWADLLLDGAPPASALLIGPRR